VQISFDHSGLDWEKYVEHDERCERPTELDALIGDYSKAKTRLGREPEMKAAELARVVVEADIQLLDDERSGRKIRLKNWRLTDEHGHSTTIPEKSHPPRV